jgi:hypothetical protein
MVSLDAPVSDIKNRLGHQSVESTMTYLQLDLSKKRKAQNTLMEYMQSKITHDKKIDELIDWKNSAEILEWLDSL